jgi:hypothetical protein
LIAAFTSSRAAARNASSFSFDQSFFSESFLKVRSIGSFFFQSSTSF